MKRRQALRSLGAVAGSGVGAGLPGCLGDGAEEPPSPTGKPKPTRTQAREIGTIEYLVRNDDDETHRLEVTMENGAGTVVHELAEPALRPGEQVGSVTAGHDPEQGPYPVTVALESLALTVHWDPTTCPRMDLLVAITERGQLSVEREHCPR